MRRYIELKDEFDEVDELPSLKKKKIAAQKVAAFHHGIDVSTNESTGVQDTAAGQYYSVSVGQNQSSVSEIGSRKHMNFILLIQTIFNNECLTDLCLNIGGNFFASLPSTTFAIL